MLLFSRVDNRNAIVEHGEGDCVLVQPSILIRAGKAIDVMVLHEVSQQGDIGAISLHFRDSVVQSGYVARGRSERIDNQIPYGKVEQATYVVLVVANSIYRIVIHFANNVYTSGRFELREKCQILFKASVKPNAVNAIELCDI